MSSRRAGAVVWPLLALLCLTVAGCGVGFGAGESSGEAELKVSRDFGNEVLVDERIDDLVESDTVLRVLDRNTEIETRYGGGFVQSIDGLSGAVKGGTPYDWLYFMDGVEANRGSAEIEVDDGTQIWWDHRNWSVSTSIPAVIGQFPAPFATFAGDPLAGVELECRPSSGSGACSGMREALKGVGVVEFVDANGDPGDGTATPESDAVSPGGDDSIPVVVGTWDAVADHPLARKIAAGPQTSGVYLRGEGRPSDNAGDTGLVGLDETGAPAVRLGAGVGLVAATRLGAADAAWLITGTDESGLESAVDAVDPSMLENRFAAIVVSGEVQPLPVR